MSAVYINPLAYFFTTRCPDTTKVQSFHQQLPDFKSTPLAPLTSLAKQLSIESLHVKDESSRCGLPAFKVLGASWATYRAICALSDLPLTTSLDQVQKAAVERNLRLYTATDGNHGRAVARMSALLGIEAHIYVPVFTDQETRAKIESEGNKVAVHGVHGDYDAAVSTAHAASRDDEKSLFVQDTSFEGYVDVPAWCVEGYSTLLSEIEETGIKPTHIITPVGVGSLAHAVVAFCKSGNRNITVIAVEPESSACLHASLRTGEMTTIATGKTIMDGMNCGSVSPISWAVLKEGVDASSTISEVECHHAVQYLQDNGVNAGPCGAGTLAGLRRVMGDEEARRALALGKQSVVVLLSTEGKRGYEVPE